jgi:hypothetical protein
VPNINDPDMKPVSFLLGGLTIGGQVHLEGTYAYLPSSTADLSSDEQVREFGAVYFEQGIRRGFPPAEETYLAPEYQERLEADKEASAQARRGPGPRTSTTQDHTEAVRTEQDTSRLGYPVETTAEQAETTPETTTPTAPQPPWEDAESLNIDLTRERLAVADDEEVARFVAWEQSRESPRVTLLRELGAA